MERKMSAPRNAMHSDYPRTKKEFAELSDTLARVFHPGFDVTRSRFLSDIADYPLNRPRFARIIRRRGKIAAHVGVYEKPVRIGRVVVPMGGIGAVACDPRYRRQGLAAKCMNDALKVMREEGVPLSFLSGIDRYYLRFGYIGCWPGYGMQIHVNALRGLRNPFRVGPFRPGDLSHLVRLYNAAAATTPSSVVRDLKFFSFAIRRLNLREKSRRAPDGQLLVFRERRGQQAPRAYVVWKDNALWETGMRPGDEAACAAVLAWLRKQRRTALEKEVLLNRHPPSHPLYRYGRRFNHTTQGGLHWTGGGMGRIVDLPALLDALRPEFEARIRTAGLSAVCRLRLSVERKIYPMTFCSRESARQAPSRGAGERRERVLKVTCTPQALLQMILGTLPFESIPEVKVAGDRAVAKALFPESSPHLYRLDSF